MRVEDEEHDGGGVPERTFRATTGRRSSPLRSQT